MTSDGVPGQKAAVDERVIDRSAIEPRTAAEGALGAQTDLLYFVATSADELTPWGRSIKLRDRQLREFVPTESVFASALYSIDARNAAFAWTLEGTPRVTARVHEILENADMGQGWANLIMKLSFDLYTQDNGAFMETVRASDSPSAALIGLNHLDAGRCWHTGIPETPVLYQDRHGKHRLLKWYDVVTFAEMPTPIETYYGLQLCALSRMMIAAQILRNVNVYKYEKTGGRHTRSIHIVRGVSSASIQQALEDMAAHADNQGLGRFVMPPIMGTVDPAVELQHVTIDLVSLPDHYDEEETFKQYLSIMAIAFGIDYQDLAPLPGGGLGTSAQSQILHLKSRGKGSALFMKLIKEAFNHAILPTGVEFLWEEQDIEAEEALADVKKTRAETRQIRVETREITPEVARQIAHDDGDLEEEYLDALGTEDITADVQLEESRPADEQVHEHGGAPEDDVIEEEKALVARLTRRLALGQKTRLGQFLQTRIHKAFTMAADDLAALGYMDTDQRIDLSHVIGDTLKDFSELISSELDSAIVQQELLAPDVRLMIEGLKARIPKNEEAAIMTVTPERLEAEEAMAEELTGPFKKLFRKLRARMRADAD